MGFFNEMWPRLPAMLSAGMRSLSPFAEVMWPGSALDLEEHDGKAFDRIITDQDKDWTPRSLSKSKAGSILFKGSFSDREFLPPGSKYRGLFREALLSQPPFTVAPIEDDLAEMLAEAYFLHVPNSADLEQAKRIIPAELGGKIVVLGPDPERMEAVLGTGGDDRIILVWDGDRPVALQLMAACKKGSLIKGGSKLSYWGHFLAIQ